jgi:endo-1,4-beta-xylanase
MRDSINSAKRLWVFWVFITSLFASPLIDKPAAAWVPTEGATIAPVTDGIRVTVAKKGEKPWSIRLNAQPSKPIAKGEKVRVAFTLRGVKSEDGKARAFLKLQLAKAPYEALAQQAVEAGPGEKIVEMNYLADRDFPVGAANLDLHVGQQAQSFEIVQFAFETMEKKMSPTPASPSSLTLKEVWADRFAIGAAIPGPELSVAEVVLLKRHFNAITPENCMKPQPIHPEEGRYAFDKADALVAFASANGLMVNAHTLVWHSQCPDWFFKDGAETASKEKVLARMREHIATVAGRYKGKVKSWDVVNEAIDDAAPYLRNSKWFQACGEDFIVEAFKAAKQADPGAELYYNDYNIELPAKRAKTLGLIRMIREGGGVIDGVGIQGHWGVHSMPLSSIERSIQEYEAEGVKVMITELDLDVVPRKTSGAEAGTKEAAGDDPYVAGLPPEMQERLAEQYAALFKMLAKYPKTVSRVTFWGLHDGRTWLNSWPRKRTNHPMLWARDLSPKPALQAVLEAGK